MLLNVVGGLILEGEFRQVNVVDVVGVPFVHMKNIFMFTYNSHASDTVILDAPL